MYLKGEQKTMFLQELGKIEAEAFLTLANEMIEDDGIVSAEEDGLIERYQMELNCPGFSYDAAACNAARNTLAELDDITKRKIYMELYSIAICDNFEDKTERMTLNALRDAFQLDAHICSALESCVFDLYSVYTEIDRALQLEPSPIHVEV